ncbi:MAG TPA: YeeE/YedE thiosulfate transporter family protein [Methanospirillum sp.]|uniref:YeeE/YedE thiosulfate transporter family protein n=1 Tax=Methanospirillum sp. TaxID=45200 RepID=UPI002CC9C021|nr:YeeE/YedE thiosulfate transporter family protein [Methanospirillum sp.]HWQ63129.1 YeeE/YedE thiosulfate transporter family protein [Methanospirillum sp.]
MDPFTAPLWSPYIAGIGIGVLLCFAMLLSNRPFGCGAAFTGVAGMIESLLRGRKKVEEKEYFKEFPLHVDWQWMFVFGIIIGAFISSLLSGTFHITWIPHTFSASFGDNPVLRLITAIIGGALIGLGARWCWGCPSSHGISGIPQLSLASFVAVACMFGVGIGACLIIFRILV